MPLPLGTAAERPIAALDALAPLLGTWRTTGSHPLLPGRTFHGRTSFALRDGGAFVEMRSETTEPEVPDALAVIGADDGAGTLTMLYVDERGVSRRYAVEVEGDRVTWSRDAPGFAQRIVLDVLAGGTRIEANGRMRRGDGDWEPDLQLVYERVEAGSP